MANITINEISQNYTWSIGSNNFATVALPITASWGPAFLDSETLGIDRSIMLEDTTWRRFAATQEGLESFVTTYRGPASNYRLAKDYSYQMAMTLLTAGYDVLVCRLCPGTVAQGSFVAKDGKTFTVKAKYPGTFGNNLQVSLKKVANRDYWNIITYVIDASGVRIAVENKVFVFNLADSTDTILHIDELESDFLTFVTDNTNENAEFSESSVLLAGGDDKAQKTNVASMMTEAINLAKSRYSAVGYDTNVEYVKALENLSKSNPDEATAATVRYKEWLYTNVIDVYDLLNDKLSYNHNRVISPGWDDQNITEIDGTQVDRLSAISPLHIKLMDVGYHSRCATALLDVPRCLPRSAVYNESTSAESIGYAQMLARYVPVNADMDINASLYQTHSALFGPWGQYTFVGTGKQNAAPPSLLALLIQRAMIKNQTIQYEWALPTNRKHNLKIGKLDYTVPKKLLDQWQKLEGVGVNVITAIPDLGTTLWGNSTLFEVPPATYQALANLSTRYLVNAIEDVIYRCGIAITFRYNNAEAYESFYAGVTPILDNMKSVGAIEDYAVRMSADINGLDQVNANTVIGKVYITVNGVVNDIICDLVALPPNVNLATFVE